MLRRVAPILATAALAVVTGWGVRAEEPDRTLRLRVNPSGFERGPETLDEKVARRTRELDYKFRMICRGCLSAAAEASLERLPDPNVRLVPVDDAPGQAVTAPRSAATAPP